MKIIYKFLFVLTAVGVLTTGCETDYVNPLDELQRGGLVKATIDPDHASLDLFTDLTQATIEFDIKPTDASGNGSDISSLDVFVTFTPAGGAPTDEFLASTETNLDGRVVYDLPSLTQLVGVDINDLFGGDKFTFSFSVNMTDGRVFDPSNTGAAICSATNARGTCTFDVNVVCSLEEGFGTGTYLLEQQTSGLFGTTFLNQEVIVSATSNTSRAFDAVYLEQFGIGQPAMTLDFDLICGTVVTQNDQATNLACSVGLRMGAADTPGSFDNTDDSVITLTLKENTSSDCGGGPVDVTFTLTKQ